MFSGVLDDGLLTLAPADHYPSIEAARGAADRFVRAWEVCTALDGMPGAIAFEYDSGDVIDRSPPPPGEPQVLQIQGVSHGQSLDHVTLQAVRSEYPPPPESFRFTSDVEVLWNRMERYHAGGEPLLSMASFCLEWLQKQVAHNRPQAAQLLNADEKVLDKLGDLAANRGDPMSARKVGHGYTGRAVTEEEREWIIAALEKLLRNLGEVGVATPRRITMGDLPAL